MKYLIIIIILLSTIIFLFADLNNDKKFIYNSKTGKYINFKTFINGIKDYSIVFFGELHDDDFCHKMEYNVYAALLNQNSKTGFALEMFERDVQHIVYNYLQDSINEEEFLNKSRPWNNYPKDYKAILEYAKAHKMPVIAANIPRNIASQISKSGENSIDTSNVDILYHKPNKDVPEYKKIFMKTMEHITMPGTPMAKMHNPENIFTAQLYKDATMAYSINEFFKNYENYKLFFICGEFHSNYHLGTVEQLKFINANLSKITIATENNKETLKKEKADFIFIKELYNNE